jgi:hypothetical protein
MFRQNQLHDHRLDEADRALDARQVHDTHPALGELAHDAIAPEQHAADQIAAVVTPVVAHDGLRAEPPRARTQRNERMRTTTTFAPTLRFKNPPPHSAWVWLLSHPQRRLSRRAAR